MVVRVLLTQSEHLEHSVQVVQEVLEPIMVVPAEQLTSVVLVVVPVVRVIQVPVETDLQLLQELRVQEVHRLMPVVLVEHR